MNIFHNSLEEPLALFPHEFGRLVVLGFNTTLTAKFISMRSVTHTRFLAFSHQY